MADLLSELGRNPVIAWAIAPILLIGFLIFIHESGHFLFAKLFGVGVERFSFGFGPRIFGFTWKETEYRVSWIPLGGYVKMVGDDPFEEVDPELRDRSFLHKPIWKKLLIVLAGPVFNLMVPVLLFAGLYMLGKPEPTTLVGAVETDSPAAQAGITVGDRIVAVSGRPVAYFSELTEALNGLPLGASTSLTVKNGDRERTVPVTLRIDQAMDEWGNEIDRNVLGVSYFTARPFVGVDSASASPAHAAGLRSGDLIERINGRPVKWWYEAREILETSPPVLEIAARRGETEVQAKISRSDFEVPILGADATRTGRVTSTEMAGHMPGAPYGLFPYELFVSEVVAGKPARNAGLKAGDMIYSVDGVAVHRWSELKRLIDLPTTAAKQVMVLRDGALRTFAVKPEVVSRRDELGRERQERLIGIVQVDVTSAEQERLRLGPIQALGKGVRETASVIAVSAKLLGRVITGDIPLSDSVGGPISIVRAAADSAKRSIFSYVTVMALISVSLGLINLLPIPLLDGGHILFFSMELVRGRPVSMRFREVSQQVGLIILFILMVFAIANDVRMTFLR